MFLAAHAVVHHVTTTGSPAGDGSIASPAPARAGIYFYRLKADRFEALQRVIVLD